MALFIDNMLTSVRHLYQLEWEPESETDRSVPDLQQAFTVKEVP